MSFAFKKVDIPADDLTWLGSKHAVNDARTVTVDGTKLTKYADGFIPSGIALTEGKDGLFVPATNPAEVDGFLLTHQRYDAGNIVAPLLDHGRILVDRLPEQDVDGKEIASPNFSMVGGKRFTGGAGSAEGNA